MSFKYHEYENTEWLKNLRIGLFAAFSTVGGIFAVLFMWGLLGLLVTNSGVGESRKYTDLDYQEYLIKNPGYKLYVNKTEITKFTRPEMEMPVILQLNMGQKDTYEVFMKETGKKAPIIVNKLYVKADGG